MAGIEPATWPNAKTASQQAAENSVQTSNRYLSARELVEPLKMRKQMTALSAGALIDDARKWNSIDWTYARRQVRRLQVRIAQAVQENRWC